MEKPIKKIKRYKTGEIEHIRYEINGKLHRENGAAYISFKKNGKISIIKYAQNGLTHSINGPTYIRYHENGKVNEKLYVTKGSYVSKDNSPSWIIYRINWQIQEERYIRGMNFHRINGPAIIRYNKHGKIISKEYYINGKIYDELSYLLKINNINYEDGEGDNG